jgi:NAD(P)-dependent dehydrogenase (short-subunit alcohol dehydrogenase family)
LLLRHFARDPAVLLRRLAVRVAAREGLGMIAQEALADPSGIVRQAACAAVVETTVTRLGRLDILVNMASTYLRRPFDELTVADWDAVLAVDLRAAVLCARARLGVGLGLGAAGLFAVGAGASALV